MSSTRNRVIYAGNTVLVSDYPSYSGQTGEYSLKLLKRIQSSSISISNPVSRAKQIGSSDFSFERYLQSPQIQASLNYLITDNSNELLLGFNATGNEGFLKNLKPAGRDRNLFFLLSNDGGQDANSITSFSGIDIFSLGNCFPTNYSLNAEVGSVPSASIDFDCLNMVFQNYQSGVSQVPAIILESGTKSTGLFYVSSGNLSPQNYLTNQDLRVSALKPGDIEMQLEQPIMGGIRYSGVVPALINSVQISVPIERKDLLGFGSNYPYDKKIVYPVVGTLSFNGTFDEAVTGDFSTIFQDTNSYNFKFNFKTPSGTTGYRVEIQNAKVENQNFDLSIGENMSFSSEFSFKIFEQDGFRVSGSSDLKEPSLYYNFVDDKAFISRAGTTGTFTRASSATRVNPSGLIENVAINVPRIDFNPSSLSCEGLLIEESRTNFALNSNDFTAVASWTSPLNCTVTAGQSDTIFSGSTSSRLIENTINGVHQLLSQTIVVSTTGTVTASFFIKNLSGSRWIYFDVRPFGLSDAFATWFNPSTGQLGSFGNNGTSTFISAKVTTMTSGWYRLELTGSNSNPSATGWEARIRLVTSNNATAGYLGNGSSGVLIQEFQFELGSFATSPIKTTGSATARSADVFYLDGANFSNIWNSTEGTLNVEAVRKQAVSSSWSGGYPRIIEADNGTSNNLVVIYSRVSEGESFQVRDTSDQALLILGSLVSAGSIIKVAARYKANDFAGILNNQTLVADTSGTVPSLSRLSIGYSGTLSNRILNGYIRKLKIFKKAFSDYDLRSLM